MCANLWSLCLRTVAGWWRALVEGDLCCVLSTQSPRLLTVYPEYWAKPPARTVSCGFLCWPPVKYSAQQLPKYYGGRMQTLVSFVCDCSSASSPIAVSQFPCAERVTQCILALPTHAHLREREQNCIALPPCTAAKRWVKEGQPY